jgi:D-3-phosphoglycerate dehydrogenase / 2-oxoglutarate reductase
MTRKVFQIDPTETLAPYTYERAAIATAGGELVVGDCLTPEDVMAQAGNAEILLLSWKKIITPAVMEALPHVRLIIRWGVGYDMVDVAAATAHGIAVANAPTYAVDDVAEHTISLLLCCARQVAWFHQRMQQGEWSSPLGHAIHRIKGRTLGLVGVGRIGAATAWRARGLGLHVIAYDPGVSAESLQSLGVESCSFDEVLRQADYLSVHVPLSAATHHLIDASCFAKLRPGAILLNTSRGPVVDEAALVAAVASGQLAGVGLDVFEQEPLAEESPLRRMEQVVLTPHMAAYSEESWQALREEVCGTVQSWFTTGWAPNIVNPQVQPVLRASSTA